MPSDRTALTTLATTSGASDSTAPPDYHSGGAQVAMTQMMRGPGNTLWAGPRAPVPERPEAARRSVHELLQVAGMFIVDMTARENEDTCADLIKVAKPRPDGQSPAQSMETIARTIAR